MMLKNNESNIVLVLNQTKKMEVQIQNPHFQKVNLS